MPASDNTTRTAVVTPSWDCGHDATDKARKKQGEEDKKGEVIGKKIEASSVFGVITGSRS